MQQHKELLNKLMVLDKKIQQLNESSNEVRVEMNDIFWLIIEERKNNKVDTNIKSY